MLNKDFRKVARNTFYHYKKVLNLSPAWHIRICLDSKVKESANVVYDYDTKRFSVTVNPKLNQDLEELKDTIIHECLHILFSPATSRLDLLIEQIRNKQPINYKQTKKKMTEWEEYLVRNLTKIILKLEKEKEV